jgi:hypothetical protein
MPLDRRNKPVARNASRAGLEETLAGLANKSLKDGRWLGKTNRYGEDTVQRLARDITGRGVNQPHLAQYVSVSTLLHCADGWSYLGRSMQALLCGDANSAIHLAYYAELRAAMSLLACQGIGVFNNKHFAISGKNAVARFPIKSPTHEFVWDCLSHWASLRSSGVFFTKIVRPHMRELEDWLTPLGGGWVLAAQARQWFRQWGMDLKTFADDRSARNVASYRPSEVTHIALNAADAVAFVDELWGALEPAAPGDFDGVDRHILRLSLEKLFFAKNGKSAAGAPAQFAAMVDNVVDHQGLTTHVAEAWKEFLLRKAQPNDLAIFQKSALEPDAGPESHLAIMSRAALLLRVASGATSHLFVEAGIVKDAIAFWRQGLGSNRGLWDEGGAPNDLTDLWSDVAASVSDIRQFAAGADHTYFRFNAYHAHTIAPLGSCERVALWSVAAA